MNDVATLGGNLRAYEDHRGIMLARGETNYRDYRDEFLIERADIPALMWYLIKRVGGINRLLGN